MDDDDVVFSFRIFSVENLINKASSLTDDGHEQLLSIVTGKRQALRYSNKEILFH
jgi:hypothetical protein